MPYDYKEVKELCRLGQGEVCCRYLTIGPHGFSCLKLSHLRDLIDQRVEEGTMRAKGDWCEGDTYTTAIQFPEERQSRNGKA